MSEGVLVLTVLAVSAAAFALVWALNRAAARIGIRLAHRRLHGRRQADSPADARIGTGVWFALAIAFLTGATIAGGFVVGLALVAVGAGSLVRVVRSGPHIARAWADQKTGRVP